MTAPASRLGVCLPGSYELCQTSGWTTGLDYAPDDAESCCGSPRRAEGDVCVGLMVCPSGSSNNSSSCISSFSWLKQSETPAVRSELLSRGGQTLLEEHQEVTSCDAVQPMGDDFEILDASSLLEETAYDSYPGGVEAALADWEAAVSDHVVSVVPAGPVIPAVSDASCCNYAERSAAPVQQCAQVLRWPAHTAAPVGLQRQQQQQQQHQQPICQQVLLMHGWGAQPQPATGAGWAAAQGGLQPTLPRREAELQQQHWQQQQQQRWQHQRQQQQRCQFTAFTGDVVGAVLEGLLPAPSSSSTGDMAMEMELALPCC